MNKRFIIMFFVVLMIPLTSVYADELVCSDENCKEKIVIKNSNTVVFPDNSNNPFVTVYRDGEKTQYIAIKQNNITNCKKSPCDNIYVDDSKKMYFEFKIGDIKNKNNLRIKIDYFTVNELNNDAISVVDYDSLKFFVVENNKFYDVDDVIYKGLVRRTTNMINRYQDNFDIISENIFSDSNLKNYDSLTVRVYPFYTYYATQGAYFDFKSISIITENYKKEEKEISQNISLNDIRNNIINREFFNATFNWLPSVSFTSFPNRQIGSFEEVKGSVFYTSDKRAKEIKSYYGMPYGFSKIGSTEEFASRISKGIYNPKNTDSIYSFSCTGSAMDAISKNIPINSSLDWNTKLFYSNETKIVDCSKSITYNNETINPSCSNIEKNKIPSLSAKEIRKEKIIVNNDGTFDIENTSSGITNVSDMYSRYANLKPGDLLVHKEVCGDSASMYCSTSGHTRMVTEDPIVVLKYDESSGKYVIDGANSYVYVTEIEHFITTVPLLENIDWTAKNFDSFSKKTGIDRTNYENSATSWLISKKYSFESLYYGYYKRNSVGVGYNYSYLGYDYDDGFKEEIYIPLTFKYYDNIAKNNEIEKPYAGLIYDNMKTYFTDNYEIKGAVKAIEDKIKEQINNNEDIKLVGTINTNYKLTGIRFEVKVNNKNKYVKEVNPVYELNNLQTRYSLYYEPEVEEINKYLNKNKDDLQEIKITVLYAGPNLESKNIKINNLSIPSNVTPSNEIVVFDMNLSNNIDSEDNNSSSNNDGIIIDVPNTGKNEIAYIGISAILLALAGIWITSSAKKRK